jgi:hypothetical protein
VEHAGTKIGFLADFRLKTLITAPLRLLVRPAQGGAFIGVFADFSSTVCQRSGYCAVRDCVGGRVSDRGKPRVRVTGESKVGRIGDAFGAAFWCRTVNTKW